MSLFQSLIINKHINQLEQQQLETAWNAFTACFHNADKQANIATSKEEQYQEGFLRDLFVDVFGYTLNPEPNFNLTTELKNLTNAKKVDGAILKEGNAIAVIELKGMDTTDLSKIETQAFGYKNNQPHCRYVITANFQKLRFYIDNAVEHLEFDLFNLNREDFSLLYLLLHKDSLLKDVPASLKTQSLSQEENITKQLYKDYSDFKRELFADICKLNPVETGHALSLQPNEWHLLLFKKSQKLLDRLLFIFFAEDSHLLPANFARTIIDEWEELQKLRVQIPLYDRFKQYFSYLNTGYNDEKGTIFAYNGGLFKPDEVLETIRISDEVLHPYIKKLSEYDFASEVDVNILGHIFENSLGEIDEVKAQIAGEPIDKKASKRKKDGVFYTPKYITKYIVENTVGKLCTDKKAELAIVDEDFYKPNRLTAKAKAQIQTQAQKLADYREWLLQLTICDPACGSGAFLNEALNFLIAEHAYIDELTAKLYGDSFVYQDVENSILENNLFGVDINEESVEIAKLSLWLRTAKPKRKLNSLNNNIKCGNSLIDDKNVVDNAFDWEQEFPQVFSNHPLTPSLNNEGEKKGFDVVIGNPPYGVNFDDDIKKFLENFDSTVPDYEIYIYFISLYRKILKQNGYLSYIFPNTFMSTLFGTKYRTVLFNDVEVQNIVDLSNDNTFSDASVRTIIFTFINNNSTDYITSFEKIRNKEFYYFESYKKSQLLENIENLFSLFAQNSKERDIIAKIKANNPLKDYYDISQGLIPYDKYRGHDEYTIKNRIWHADYQKDETYRKELKGADVSRYNINWNGSLWISYGDWLAAPRDKKYFTENRILVREITKDKLFCGYTEDEYYNTPSCINIVDEKDILNLKYSLTILNSSLIGWYHNKTSPKANKGLFPKILINDIKNLPLIEISKEQQQPFIEKANQMLTLNKELQSINAKFQRMLNREFNIDTPNKKLQMWYSLNDSDFFKELEKDRKKSCKTNGNDYKKLSLSDKADWEDYFLAEQQKAQAIQQQITQTDKQIDNMVYQLYNLTDDEIKIIEES